MNWIRSHRKQVILYAVVLVSLWFYFSLPDPLFNDPLSMVVESDEGYLLSAQIAKDGQWRFPVIDSVPEKFKQCILHFEDEYFYQHPGFNPISFARAMRQNIAAKKVVSGGSTISMQVIRLARKGQSRSVLEKAYETILALRLELKYSKEEILALHASYAPFGGNVVGIETASWRYYGRPPASLSWGEAATLAVLPNAPSLMYPGKNTTPLKNKRDRLLQKLANKGVIDSLDATLAMEEPIPEAPKRLPQLANHIMYRSQSTDPNKHRVQSTIDKELQIQCNDILDRFHALYSQNEIHNAAILVMEVESREIKAYVGNTNCDESESGRWVDIIQAPRSSGSILKPFLYAAMLQEGSILPHTLIADIPTHMSGYRPQNFDKEFDGAVKASDALARSLNIPAIKMLQSYGIEKFHTDLNDLGFKSFSKPAGHYGLSMILGGGEVSLWELVRSYGELAKLLNQFKKNGLSKNIEPYGNPSFIQNEIKDEGRVSKFSPAAAWQTLEVLRTVKRPMSENGWQHFSSSGRVAWKTGTSFGHRDAWAVGVTPTHVVAIWVGNADGEGRPGLTGLNYAAPILFEVFDKIPSTPWFAQPFDDQSIQLVCSKSGLLASVNCESADSLWLPTNSARADVCIYHHLVHLDENQQYRVNASCYPSHKIVTKPWFILPPSMEAYYRTKDPFYKSVPSLAAACVGGSDKVIDIIYPSYSSRIYVPRMLNGDKSLSVFEAVHRDQDKKIYWHLNEEFLGATLGNHRMPVEPEFGENLLTLVDEEGNSVSRSFEVISR